MLLVAAAVAAAVAVLAADPALAQGGGGLSDSTKAVEGLTDQALNLLQALCVVAFIGMAIAWGFKVVSLVSLLMVLLAAIFIGGGAEIIDAVWIG